MTPDQPYQYTHRSATYPVLPFHVTLTHHVLEPRGQL